MSSDLFVLHLEKFINLVIAISIIAIFARLFVQVLVDFLWGFGSNTLEGVELDRLENLFSEVWVIVQ